MPPNKSKPDPSSADPLFAQALAHHQNGRVSEAEGLYRRALEQDPGHASSLNNLGLIVPASQKIDLFERLLALLPDYLDGRVNLADALAAVGRNAEAERQFRRALVQEEGRADIHFKLGVLFEGAGRLDEAALAYARAAELKPDFVAALFALGNVFALASLSGGPEELEQVAADWYRKALALDPDLGFANLFLVKALESHGRLIEAESYRARVPRPQPLEILPSADPRRTILMICTPSVGNTPLHTVMPADRNRQIKWFAEYATDGQEAELPAYDLVFNAIGNAELSEVSYGRLKSFAERCGRPFLNRPERVAATRRDLMPALLGDLPGLVVPAVVRLSREEIAQGNLEERLAQEGLACPLIVRPIVYQGGTGAKLVRHSEDLATLVLDEADYHYFIEFFDCRGVDGYFRKYRTFFIDRQPFHYHLAISSSWLVHYFSADMLAEPWKCQEELRYLMDPEAALGPMAAAAVAAVGRRMDMDFAGIDYSVLPDGRLLLFEANATMSVFFPDPAAFPYKRPYIQAIIDAFEAMLVRRLNSAAAR